jgi:hypothetical protein
MVEAAAEQVPTGIEAASDQAAAQGLASGEMRGPPGDSETPAAEGEAAVEEMGKTA